MFLAFTIVLIGVSVAAVFLGMRQLSATREEPAARQARSLEAAPVGFDAQLVEELEALRASMHRKPPKPIMTAIAILLLQVLAVAIVTYLYLVTFVPPLFESMTMVFYAISPLLCAFGLWEGGRRWAWRSVMVMQGGTIAALPRLAEELATGVLGGGEELVYVLVGLAWQLSIIIPLWMPSARAWCRPTS